MKVNLTKREWDHVLLALENSADTCFRLSDINRNKFLSYIGSQRAGWRHTDVGLKIVKQLKWDHTPSAKTVWKLEVKDERVEKGQTQ